ncbi:helix-turn-helix transcriptional regulator [Alteromonas macleodii]|uniref:helix-turn-helix transcriptional regulator n=1 Tax=Alteromonas macleodii TaxID=28108 RepID=UPI003CFC7E6B
MSDKASKQTTVTDDPFLRMSEVEKTTGLKKSTIYLLIKRSEFPSPIKLGSKASGWLLSEINQWKAERIAISRGEQE